MLCSSANELQQNSNTVRPRNTGAQPADEVAERIGHGLAGRVGDRDARCAGLDRRLRNLDQEGAIGARRVLGGEHHMLDAGPRMFDGPNRLLQGPFGRFPGVLQERIRNRAEDTG